MLSSVANSVTSTTVDETASDTAATITSTDLGSKALAVGPNTITVNVTAQDGTTAKTYTVTVTKAPSTSDGGNNFPVITVPVTSVKSTDGKLKVPRTLSTK